MRLSKLRDLLKLRDKGCKLFSYVLGQNGHEGAGLGDGVVGMNSLAGDPLSAGAEVIKATGDFKNLSESIHVFPHSQVSINDYMV